MALPSQYARIDLRYGHNENMRQENVLWFQPDATIAFADGVSTAQALATAFDTAVAAAIKDCIASDAGYIETHVELNLGGVTFEGVERAGTNDGTATGVTSAENVATVIRKVTEHGGKTGRGRWFIGCVPEEFATIGKLDSTPVSKYNALAVIFIAPIALTGVNFGPRHYSRKDASLYPIRRAIVVQYTKSQRRRLPRPF